jgi:hypothetical protein
MGLGFELRALHLQSRHSTFEPTHLQSILLWLFKDGILKYLSRLALNRDPPGLSLQSSYDYRCELPVSG